MAVSRAQISLETRWVFLAHSQECCVHRGTNYQKILTKTPHNYLCPFRNLTDISPLVAKYKGQRSGAEIAAGEKNQKTSDENLCYFSDTL